MKREYRVIVMLLSDTVHKQHAPKVVTTLLSTSF